MSIAVYSRRRRRGDSILVSDSFNRSDHASSLGTADSGQTWTAYGDPVGISSNAAYLPGGGAGVHGIDAGAPDVELVITLSVAPNGFAGVIARLSDATNYLRIGFDNANGYIQKVEGGTLTTTASAAIGTDDGDVMRAVLRGSSITLYLEGVEVVSATQTFNQSETIHGLSLVGSTAARLDDFFVKAG